MRRFTGTAVPLATLVLVCLPAARADETVGVRLADGKAEFTVGGQVAAVYHTAGQPKPILYPVLTPAGQRATRDYPMRKDTPGETKDHPHHRSVWFCHGDVIPQGLEVKQKIKGIDGVDFWSEHQGHGVIACTEVKEGPGGKNYVTLDTKNEWRTADGQKVLDEARRVVFVNLGKGRLYVLEIDLHASVCPVVFGDTKEGSMAVRVNDQINEKAGGVMTNADGVKGEKSIWGRPSDWVDYTGTVDGKTFGLAVFDDAGNPARANWHARGYGLLGANPFGRARSGFPAVKGNNDLVTLPQGGHLRLRYGVYVHDGDAAQADVAGAYRQFSEIVKK